MTTYITMNILFLLLVLLIALAFIPVKINRSLTYTLLIVLLLTAIFDSLIIGLGIVDYNYDKTLGLLIGLAPIEDFFYAVLAVFGIVWLWEYHENKL